MDSLSRGALIHTFAHTPFNTNSTPLSSPLLFPLVSSTPQARLKVKVFSSFSEDFQNTVQNTSKALIFSLATGLMLGKFSQFPAKAEPLVAIVGEQEQEQEKEQEQEQEKTEEMKLGSEAESPLSEFLESHTEAIDALKSLLQRKLEDGEDEEALKILKKLISAQPLELEWKFLVARLYNEMGEKGEARKVYEEILEKDPLCFDALFQTAVLMDQNGEGQAAIQLLEERLILAQEEQKESEARNVRLILAQIQYLQRNIDEALRSYEELAKEDPKDYRPYFYQFVIYSLLDRNEEAKAQFAKCSEVCPKDFKVEGFLQTPLSRMKLFGSDN